jgi:hypothetical protein
MSAGRNIPALAIRYAERVMADWPADVQPLLRQGVFDKVIAGIKLYAEENERAAAEPEACAVCGGSGYRTRISGVGDPDGPASIDEVPCLACKAEPEAKACATCGGSGTEHLQPPAYYPCRPCPSCKAEPEAPMGEADCPRCGEQMGWPTGAEPPTVHDVCEDCETEITMLAAGWTPPKAEPEAKACRNYQAIGTTEGPDGERANPFDCYICGAGPGAHR